jgi:uncharacterized membrane protein
MPASPYSVLQNCDIYIAVILGAVFLGEKHLAMGSIVGAWLISGGAFVLGVRQILRQV